MSHFAHESSIEIAVPAEQAFAYIASGMKQGEWALGSWNRRDAGDGIFVGTLAVRRLRALDPPERPPRPAAGRVRHRHAPRTTCARWSGVGVVPGPVLGLADDHCVVTFTIWRGAAMDDAGWELMSHTFPTELRMIKGRLELGF